MKRPTVLLRNVYVRALGVVHLLSVASLWPQLDGLVGPHGILPQGAFMEAVGHSLGLERYWRAPSLLWFVPGDSGLHAVCGVAMLAATLLVAGAPFEGPLLLLLWLCWITLCTAGQLFLGFQWDALLSEATFAALFVAAWRPGQPETPTWAWWLQRWLALRLMFFGGLVKLTSGDPTWWSGTALDVHFWTQPLPNPWSRAFAELPHPVLAAGVVLTFVVELGLPVVALLGRPGRAVAFVGFALLMGLLFVSGNFGAFQILSVVVCLSLLDDDLLRRVPLPWPQVTTERRGWHLGAPLAVALVLLSLLRVPDPREIATDLALVDPSWRPPPDEAWPPDWTEGVVRQTQGLRIVNRYGLFARMTTTRPEVVLEASWDDGQTWRELAMVAKPGDPTRRPPQVAPHMPRLDWQLWFAALGSCARNPWVASTMRRLVEGSEPVMDLFAPGTFPDGAPDRVRATRWRYEPAQGATWWTRADPRPYCPEVGGR